MTKRVWRFIKHSATSGAWNMAVDEALLSSMSQDGAVPVLRLYAWTPPCLSLGYTQSVADVDPAGLIALNADLVRRPTGGKAILHTDELTYAIVAPLTEPAVEGSVLESYQRLAQALLLALQYIGLPARSDRDYHTSPDLKGPVCFEVPSHYEITVGGKKLIGSAQARRNEGVLQHGALPLFGDLTRITRCLSFPTEQARTLAASRLLERATTVETVLKKQISWEDAAQAFQIAFTRTFEIEFNTSDLTSQELEKAHKLLYEKYGNTEWIRKL